MRIIILLACFMNFHTACLRQSKSNLKIDTLDCTLIPSPPLMIPPPPSLLNAEQKREYEWEIYFKNFKKSFIENDNYLLGRLIRWYDFYDSGDTKTGCEWVNCIFQKQQSCRNTFNEIRKLIMKPTIVKDGEMKKYLKGNKKVSDLIFEYIGNTDNYEWKLIGLREHN